MPCYLSCAISAIFIIAMIYFYNNTNKTAVVKHYKQILSSDLQKKYDELSRERLSISYQGYGLGFLLSLFVILYNIKLKSRKLSNLNLVCIVLAISFLTNYFYYMLYPKSDWMLNHLSNPQEIKAWLAMYKTMQFNYHIGLVLGIIGVAIFAFAFRC